LLEEAGYSFDVIPPSELAETDAGRAASTRELVAQLAWQKAADVARQVERGIIIGCDTVADVNGQILGKPRDRSHAQEMLQLLRGKQHCVYSGLCVWHRPSDKARVEVDVTTLEMDDINDHQIMEYLNSGAWQGKAGGFGYQDRLGWIHILEGSESNVVGLPLERLSRMLEESTS
jgi:septum formation protein